MRDSRDVHSKVEFINQSRSFTSSKGDKSICFGIYPFDIGKMWVISSQLVASDLVVANIVNVYWFGVLYR